MKYLSFMAPLRMYRSVRDLHRKLNMVSNDTVSRAAVIRLLIYLGLRAAQRIDAEELLDIAKREGLL